MGSTSGAGRQARLAAFQSFVDDGRTTSAETRSLVEVVERPNQQALVIPAAEDVDLVDWSRANTGLVRDLMHRHGAVRFRGFHAHDRSTFRGVFSNVSPVSMDYQDKSSPRQLVEQELYTSTDHPASELIRMHCELSYSDQWPCVIGFFCETPADSGGETPLADTRRVLSELSSGTRDEFERRGVRYCRNLLPGLGLSWAEVFGTDVAEEVERLCRERGIEHRWLPDDGLQIRWSRPAVRQHPVTGETVWFNHAAFFHSSTLDREITDALGSEQPLPFSTSFGDGSPIPASVVEEIEAAYERVSNREPWEQGDIVIADNMLTAHGRMPFTGRRRVYVMMGTPVR